MPNCKVCEKHQAVLSSGGLCIDDAQKLGFGNTSDFNRGIISVEQARQIIHDKITKKGE